MKYFQNINLFSFYLLFLFSFNYTSSNKYLKLPISLIDFPSKEELSSINIYNLLTKLSKSRIQTRITLGSNRQILPCDISFEHYPLYVSSILCEENIIKFNQEESRTFINYDKIDGYNINQNCLKCNTSKDIFYFNHDKINEAVPLFFIFGSLLTTESKSISAEIGFKPTKPKNDPSVLNLLLQLKKANLISNKNFFFHLDTNENKGNLLLGAYNEKFFQNYQKFKYFYVSAENGNIEYWQFLLDNAYYGNNYICEKNKVIISLKQYFIYVPFYIKSILDNDFFKELTEKKICELINLNNTSTYFYVCDDTIDINKMKNFSFFPTNLNEPIEFILSPKDLFFKFGKNKLLYIIGFNYNVDYWKFNLPFIMKYQPVFDLDNKIISIYNDLNLFSEDDFIYNNEQNKNNPSNEFKEKEGNNFGIKILYFFIFLFLILIILILFKKIFDYYKKGKNKENDESQLLEFRDMSNYNEDSQDNNKKDNSKENKIIA